MPGTFADEAFEGAGQEPGLEIWRIEVRLNFLFRFHICLTQYCIVMLLIHISKNMQKMKKELWVDYGIAG